MPPEKVDKLLIIRTGSLGDTLMALPCLKHISRRYCQAKRHLLTNMPVNNKASTIESILHNTKIVHQYHDYPHDAKFLKKYQKLRRLVNEHNIQVLIYLNEAKGLINSWRDYLIFKSLGIKQVIGIPLTPKANRHLWLEEKKCYESEGQRLARCLSRIGPVDTNDWALDLTNKEKNSVTKFLSIHNSDKPLIICSIGAKCDVKNWGMDNWQSLIDRLNQSHAHCQLAFIGVENEYQPAQQLLARWRGLGTNLCGQLSIRQSAAVLAHADLFIGHDSGPMHLAASQNTPAVAIFSARSKPGVWFPYGQQHRVIYHQPTCYNCGLENCIVNQKKCIRSITIDEVMYNVNQIIASG